VRRTGCKKRGWSGHTASLGNRAGCWEDALLNAVAAFAIVAIVGEILVGYSDLQLDTYRNLIVFGALLGLLNRLPKLSEDTTK
jgi:hypothetical protein